MSETANRKGKKRGKTDDGDNDDTEEAIGVRKKFKKKNKRWSILFICHG